MKNKTLLIILDGWGIAKKSKGNAISLAKKPNFDSFWAKYPHVKLDAGGKNVGLPNGQMGNSEVGHMAMGSGRVIWQYLPRISESIEDKSFFKNKELKKAFSYARKNNKKVHLLGLVSDGGVHSHENHLYAILKAAKKQEVKNIFVHAFTDGRDVSPKSGIKYIKKLNTFLNKNKAGEIATISGRYYAMDRDKRWARTKKAYDVLVVGKGNRAKSAEEAIYDSYQKNIDDEFIKPVIINEDGLIKNGDVIFFFNFRNDRPRQLARALLLKNFKNFKREKIAKDPYSISMMLYEEKLPVKGVLFPREEVKDSLAETISKNKMTQFHAAETEKYPHVTFFFNGEREKPFTGEERLMVGSPKVATYDMKPEMSVKKITKELLKRIGKYDFIVVNFANADMVGHTGDIGATQKAVETIDQCLGRVAKKGIERGYKILITGDHGNAEEMRKKDGSKVTAHTANKVPFIILDNSYQINKLKKYTIASMAPTVLYLLDIKKPKVMTENSLVYNK